MPGHSPGQQRPTAPPERGLLHGRRLRDLLPHPRHDHAPVDTTRPDTVAAALADALEHPQRFAELAHLLQRPDVDASAVMAVLRTAPEAAQDVQRALCATDIPLRIVRLLDVAVVDAVLTDGGRVGGLAEDELVTRLVGLPLSFRTLSSALAGTGITVHRAADVVGALVADSDPALLRRCHDELVAGGPPTDLCARLEDHWRCQWDAA